MIYIIILILLVIFLYKQPPVEHDNDYDYMICEDCGRYWHIYKSNGGKRWTFCCYDDNKDFCEECLGGEEDSSLGNDDESACIRSDGTRIY